MLNQVLKSYIQKYSLFFDPKSGYYERYILYKSLKFNVLFLFFIFFVLTHIYLIVI